MDPQIRTAIVAHRGASRSAPENTVAAFKLGWEVGSDGIELDLHLAKDGQIVIIHDHNTRRTTGFDAPVSSLTLKEIKELDAGSFKDPHWKGECIPTLNEVLVLTPKGKSVFLELKDSGVLLDPLERALTGTPLAPEQIILIAFDYSLIVEAKKRFPRYSALWLQGDCGKGLVQDWPSLRHELILRATQGGLDGLDLGTYPPSISASEQFIDADFVGQAHDAGLSVVTWTINEASLAERLIAAGVDGITTDDPKLLLAHRAALHSQGL